MATVSRLIVSYNSAPLMEWQARVGAALPTLVVDNASSDASVSEAKRAGFDVLALAQNHGFGRAIMAGLRRLDSTYAIVLNADATIDDAAIGELLDTATTFPDCDILVPLLEDESGRPFFRHEACFEPRVRDRRVPDGLACIPMFSGAVLFVRIEPFLAFGGFDPAIFLYFEDDDLALRYQAARKPVLFVPHARAVHLGDRSSGSGAHRVKDISFGWSRAFVQRRHANPALFWTLAGMILKLPVYLFGLRLARLGRQIGRIRGFVGAMRNAPAPFLPPDPPTDP